ncbi:unnamed protein product [Arabidopsis halleri]
MLARVLRSESASASARLISTRLIHLRVAKKGRIRKRLPFSSVHCSGSEGTFVGERLKLTSGSHYIQSLDDAIDLFNEMVRSRPLYSAIDFNKLIGVIVRMELPGVAISLYQKMELLQIPCNICSFDILIKCFCDCHKFSFALSTFGKITKLGFQPNVVTFNTLINGFCIEDRMLEAVALFDRMVEEGHQPDVVTYGTIVNGMCKIGDTVSALNLLRKMEECHIEANVRIYNAIIGCLCKDGHHGDAQNLFTEMQEKGISPNVPTAV